MGRHDADVTCPDCRGNYSNLSSHLSRSSECHFPNLTSRQKSILTGLLMGDGYLDRSNSNPALVVDMVEKEFLCYLRNEFPICSRDVYCVKSGEQQKRNLKNGLGRNADECKDLYRWKSISSPRINFLKEWYSSGEKVFPNQITLDPLILKMWYVCDGTYFDFSDRFGLRIYNHTQKQEKLESYFDIIGIQISKDESVNGVSFDADNSAKLIDYIGEPVPGFEYKWPK